MKNVINLEDLKADAVTIRVSKIDPKAFLQQYDRASSYLTSVAKSAIAEGSLITVSFAVLNTGMETIYMPVFAVQEA